MGEIGGAEDLILSADLPLWAASLAINLPFIFGNLRPSGPVVFIFTIAKIYIP
jgi:hypothetical protein